MNCQLRHPTIHPPWLAAVRVRRTLGLRWSFILFMGLLRTTGENEVAWLAGWSYHICERMLVFLDGRPGRSS